MRKLHQIILHTGSNSGDRLGLLMKANALLGAQIGKIVKASNFFDTAAWGVTDQASFLNQALILETALTAHDALTEIHTIEEALGRVRTMRWGPRTIDIDILFYADLVINTPKLSIPHPQIEFRNFVLTPLAEIAPSYLHPVLGKTILELKSESKDILSVKLLNN